MRLKVGSGRWQSRLTLGTRASSHLSRRTWVHVGGCTYIYEERVAQSTKPRARAHNDGSSVLGRRRVALPFGACVLFRKSSSFQCSARNCWQSSPRGQQEPLSQFQGSRRASAVGWLHKNEITQEIKLAQISAQNIFGNKNWDIVVTLEQTNRRDATTASQWASEPASGTAQKANSCSAKTIN